MVERARSELLSRLLHDEYLPSRVEGIRVEVRRKALFSTFKKAMEKGEDVKFVRDIAQVRDGCTCRVSVGTGGAGRLG